jgi:hypothetical protein
MTTETKTQSCGCNVETRSERTSTPRARCACGERCQCGAACRCEGCSHRQK